jgi:hypothetical protein
VSALGVRVGVRTEEHEDTLKRELQVKYAYMHIVISTLLSWVFFTGGSLPGQVASKRQTDLVVRTRWNQNNRLARHQC